MTSSYTRLDFISPKYFILAFFVGILLIPSQSNAVVSDSKGDKAEEAKVKSKRLRIGKRRLSVEADVQGELNCKNAPVIISAKSESSDVSYNWTGPNNFQAVGATQQVDVPGIYVVTAYNELGDKNTVKVRVEADQQAPDLAIIKEGESEEDLIFLNAESSVAEAIFYWQGPNGLETNDEDIKAVETGQYTLSIVDPVNGCKSSRKVAITGKEQVPALEAMATASKFSAQLQATATHGALVSWTGPNGFRSDNPSPTVTKEGTYTATAISGNGIQISTKVEVNFNSNTDENYWNEGNGKTHSDVYSNNNHSKERPHQAPHYSLANKRALSPPLAINYQVFPNPVEEYGNLEIETDQNTHVSAYLISMTGSRNKQLFDGEVEAHTSQNISFEMEGMGSGVFIIRIVANGENYDLKIARR